MYTDGSVTKDLIVYTDGSVTKDLIVYIDGSVTKDQSGWGFTVKQGATLIHEDIAAYTVSTSSLTMEVEAVTHAHRWIASRGDNQSTHAIFLTDSMSLLQKMEWEAQTGMCQWSTSTFENSWACRSEGKSPSRQTGGKSNPHKWLASVKI